MWLAVLLALAPFGTPEKPQFQISFDERHEFWQPLTDSTEIPFRSSCWVKVPLSPDMDGMILKGGNWYMRGMEYYDSEFVSLGSGNYIDLGRVDDSLIYVHYPFIDEKAGGINIEVLSKTDLLKLENQKNNFEIGFQTVFLFVALVLLLFALRSRDNLYWHFFFYVISIAYFFAYQYGLLGWIFPYVDTISPTWWWISSASISLAYAFFAQSFLRLRERDKHTFYLFEFGKYFILLVVSAEVISHLLSYDLQHQIVYKVFVLLVEIPLMFYIIYRIFRQGDILSRLFVTGMLILALSSLTAQLLSTMRLTVESNYFIQSGLLLDILIFSIGVSVRVGIVYRDQERAQENLIEQLKLNDELQKKYTGELEETVKKRTEELAKRNEENELLLREVHHRVKNNLQMISSLLSMQKRRLKDQQSIHIMDLTQNRVNSIGLIHEHLYQHNDFSTMSLHDYIKDLVNILVDEEQFEHKPQVDLEITDLRADIDTSIPIGLVLNELITNSIKYGFSSVKHPLLRIALMEKSGRLILEVSDNGNSQKKDFEDRFGWTIIRSTLASMEADFDVSMNDGFHVRIEIKKYKVMERQLT